MCRHQLKLTELSTMNLEWCIHYVKMHSDDQHNIIIAGNAVADLAAIKTRIAELEKSLASLLKYEATK
jgi:hypothetical protein